jgi:hypothetical protein
LIITSPYDRDARYCRKRDTIWAGYKVHLTETCAQDAPQLITHVGTTVATAPHAEMIPTVHRELADKDLLPDTHLVDTGYVDAGLLVTSQQMYGVDLLGPVRENHEWQARAAQGFAGRCFVVDWAAQQVTCPQGHTSAQWTPTQKGDTPIIKVAFARSDCTGCVSRPQWTRAVVAARTLTLRPQA